ncbi:MAG: hypothetical protein N2746_04825 [Deltaproteobacteria bacterium]|nr:hypothetical protein [Deltaproteobacteria bacterium]
MTNKLFSLILCIKLFLLSIDCQKDSVNHTQKDKPFKPDLETLYTRIYRLIEYGEYDIAFSEMAYMLNFYTQEERKNFDIQNLFAKYIIEGHGSLENIIENYTKIFDVLDSSDAEALYQIIMYHFNKEGNIEKAISFATSKVEKGNNRPGLYFFLAYTFYNFKMWELAYKYLDCLITLAPNHVATSYLTFRVRGKKPNYKAEAVESLRNLIVNDKSQNIDITVATNFHIPAMINREWEKIGDLLLHSNNYLVKRIAYSEIPIFYAQKGNSDKLYQAMKEQIMHNDYQLFSLVSRSLLYIFKDPIIVIDRLKADFGEHPFIMALSAKFLVSEGLNNLVEATNLFMKALEQDNNIDIFFEAVDLFRRTSLIFKLKPFAEELIYKYPYNTDLYESYRLISSDPTNDEFFKKYLELLPESVNKYLILISISKNIETKEKFLLEGLKAFKDDCNLILEIIKLYNRCEADNFIKAYRTNLSRYITLNEINECLKFVNEEERVKLYNLAYKGKKEGCKTLK